VFAWDELGDDSLAMLLKFMPFNQWADLPLENLINNRDGHTPPAPTFILIGIKP